MGKRKDRGIEGLVEEEWSLGELGERRDEPRFIEEEERRESRGKSEEKKEGKEKGNGERVIGERGERGKRKGNWQRYSVLGLVLSMGMGLGYAGKAYEEKITEGLKGAVSYVGNYIGKEIKKEGGKELAAKELVMVQGPGAKEAGGERSGKEQNQNYTKSKEGKK